MKIRWASMARLTATTMAFGVSLLLVGVGDVQADVTKASCFNCQYGTGVPGDCFTDEHIDYFWPTLNNWQNGPMHGTCVNLDCWDQHTRYEQKPHAHAVAFPRKAMEEAVSAINQNDMSRLLRLMSKDHRFRLNGDRSAVQVEVEAGYYAAHIPLSATQLATLLQSGDGKQIATL